MNNRTGFTVDGQSVDFTGTSQENDEEWDVNDDPDLDPAYMYARNARGASGYQGFDSASYPHYQYPDETQDNEYYQENNNNSRTNNNDADIIERYGMANGIGDLDEQDGEIKKMPEEYYSSLDVFLSKGPPRILRDRGGGKGDGKLATNTNVKGKQQQTVSSKSAKKGVASTVGGVPVGLGSSNAAYSAVKSSGYGPAATSGSKGKKQVSGGVGGRGGLDEDLLKEAFAYTDKLLREAVLEEQEESQMMMIEKSATSASKQSTVLNNNHRSSSHGNHLNPVPPTKGSSSSSSSHHSVAAAYAPAAAPRPPPRSFGGSGGSGGLTLSQLQGMNNVSVVQRLRDEVQGTTAATHASSSSMGAMAGTFGGGEAAAGSGFRVSSVGLDQPEVLREGQAKADLASLVNNFESGATLAKLKAELEASQRARDKSR